MKRLAAILLVLSHVATASEISAHWHDLAAMVTGEDIVVDVTDGKHIRGVALAIEGESLIMETHKRGRQTIARTDVREIRIPRKASYKWRAIGTAIGGGAGAAIAIPVLTETHNEGSGNYDGAAAGVVAGLAILGFVLGWQADHARDIVRILPD
jgi:hypothetical protein